MYASESKNDSAVAKLVYFGAEKEKRKRLEILASNTRVLPEKFLNTIDSCGISQERLLVCAEITESHCHHPDFEAAWANLDETDPDRILYYIFGEVVFFLPHMISDREEFFARRNCQVEEALETLLRLSDFDRKQYDAIEFAICEYCNSHQHKRNNPEELMQFLESRLGDNVSWRNSHDGLLKLGTIFGYPDFLLQQGPREAALAVFEGRIVPNEPMRPFFDQEDFPKHENGMALARVYNGSSEINMHVDETGKKIVSKKVPVQVVRNYNPQFRESNDYPPAEIHTNAMLQDCVSSLSPNIDQPCPFIVKHLGTTAEEGEKIFYYWMEAGEDFHTWITKNNPDARESWINTLSKAKPKFYKREKSPWHKARTFDFIRVAAAVKYMHEMRIYHRNLKLENLILVDGKVKLIGFGASLRFSWCDSSNRAQDRIGTPAYVSPECYNCGTIAENDYDCEKNDVWQLGHILFGMLFARGSYSTCSIKDTKFRYLTNDSYTPENQRDEKKNLRNYLKHTNDIRHATDLLLDFLENIFCPEEERFTMDEIFEHGWLEEELLEMRYELHFLQNCQFYKEFFDSSGTFII